MSIDNLSLQLLVPRWNPVQLTQLRSTVLVGRDGRLGLV